MFRFVCLFVLLPLCVFGQTDVLLSTPSNSFIFPTDQPTGEETLAPTAPPTTKHSDAVTAIASTPEPNLPSSTTPQPALNNDATETTWESTSTVEPSTPAPQATSFTMTPPAPQATDSTTVPPTPQTTNSTTVPPTPQPTNSTTAPTPQPTNSTTAPTPQPTNSTTAPPTPQPTNSTPTTSPAPTTPPTPSVGDYVVRADSNSSVCLMARMGLQFSLRMGDIVQTLNLDPNPNVTITSGTCGKNGSDAVLVLISDNITVQFIFTTQMSKFSLSGLNMTVVNGSGPTFTAVNTSLSLWEASLGSSYMCRKEQSFNITHALILNTFELQVQPFEITNDKFSTAHECSVDDTSLLIPIIVGAALAVLILIVVIAYVIGRRKTYVGYQTL